MKKKLLIVDDSSALRIEMRAILETAGFEVHEACDGYEALEQFAKIEQISLIFCDLNMPRLSGIEFIRRLRQIPEGVGVPVIVITADCSPEQKAKAKELKVIGWMVKPYRKENIIGALNRLFGENHFA